MIRIHRPEADDVLSMRTRKYLSRKSAEVSGFSPGDSRIRTKWAGFLGTAARKDVETALDKHTYKKCAYCENIAAKDIEHFYPKTIYPDRMFSWDNFLRSCKNCNNAKVDRFPLDKSGNRLLIDPCTDEPMDYFFWDFQTGATGIAPHPSRQPRAAKTREMFQLDQEPLREERRAKVGRTLYLLARVVNEDPVTTETCKQLEDEFLPHRPWLGSVRQLLVRPGTYQPLVEAALLKLPQIRDWARDWLRSP